MGAPKFWRHLADVKRLIHQRVELNNIPKFNGCSLLSGIHALIFSQKVSAGHWNRARQDFSGRASIPRLCRDQATHWVFRGFMWDKLGDTAVESWSCKSLGFRRSQLLLETDTTLSQANQAHVEIQSYNVIHIQPVLGMWNVPREMMRSLIILSRPYPDHGTKGNGANAKAVRGGELFVRHDAVYLYIKLFIYTIVLPSAHI